MFFRLAKHLSPIAQIHRQMKRGRWLLSNSIVPSELPIGVLAAESEAAAGGRERGKGSYALHALAVTSLTTHPREDGPLLLYKRPPMDDDQSFFNTLPKATRKGFYLLSCMHEISPRLYQASSHPPESVGEAKSSGACFCYLGKYGGEHNAGLRNSCFSSKSVRDTLPLRNL